MDIKKYFTRQFAPVILVIVVTVFLLVYHFVFSAPSSFIKDGSIIIEPGQTVSGIAQELAAENVVRSPITFKVLVTIMGGERSITAGLYAFPKPQNIFSIAFRIAHSDFGYTPIKFTVPEGLTSMEIAKLVHDKFPDTDQVTAAASLKQYEGELFPDTYFFPPQAPLQIISDRMLQQFNTNIAKLQPDIASSTHSLDDIIKVASILEKEVQNDTDRRLVADLIWRRLALGMPLQADSALSYITDKPSLELTAKDLQIDSPYNLYRFKGLPPTPISNPGMAAIDAAIHPTPNKYLYFLSDKNGINHFAVTYSEHVKNRKKYLGK